MDPRISSTLSSLSRTLFSKLIEKPPSIPTLSFSPSHPSLSQKFPKPLSASSVFPLSQKPLYPYLPIPLSCRWSFQHGGDMKPRSKWESFFKALMSAQNSLSLHGKNVNEALKKPNKAKPPFGGLQYHFTFLKIFIILNKNIIYFKIIKFPFIFNMLTFKYYTYFFNKIIYFDNLKYKK